jgi:hypothetical protein
MADWQTLTRMTAGAPFVVERVRLLESGVAIEGAFEVPPLAQLPAEDQTFVAAFVRCHGSIKQMEEYFGVSYPTIKNRLNRIGERLPFVEISHEPEAPAKAADLLDRLDKGEMSAAEVIAALRGGTKETAHE